MKTRIPISGFVKESFFALSVTFLLCVPCSRATSDQTAVPSLRAPSVSAPASDSSPAGVARKFEAEIESLQHKMADLKRRLTEEDEAIRSASDEINKLRAEFSAAASKNPLIAEMDKLHSERLKEYAEMESTFNRFRTHWMTHQKPLRRQDGTLVSNDPAPLKGCPDCQKDFDKFIKGDPSLMAEYKDRASKMLVDLNRKRSELLGFTIRRAEEINKLAASDGDLSSQDSKIKSAEEKLTGLIDSVDSVKTLQKQIDDLRIKLDSALQASVRVPGGGS